MLENYITQVRRTKGVSSEREAFVSRAAQASTAACLINNTKNSMPYFRGCRILEVRFERFGFDFVC